MLSFTLALPSSVSTYLQTVSVSGMTLILRHTRLPRRDRDQASLDYPSSSVMREAWPGVHRDIRGRFLSLSPLCLLTKRKHLPIP